MRIRTMQVKFSTLVLASALCATAALVTVPALAAQTPATLHVPFSFAVDGVILPAGDYRVDRDPGGKVICLQNEHGGRSFSWTTQSAPVANQRVILHFEARGHSYVLDSIQYGGLTTPPPTRKATRIEDVSTAIRVGR
jgi:hypothetical protein